MSAPGPEAFPLSDAQLIREEGGPSGVRERQRVAKIQRHEADEALEPFTTWDDPPYAMTDVERAQAVPGSRPITSPA